MDCKVTTRVLPREEYDRLAGTELETVAPHLPESARVIVVEQGDAIVGCWAVFPVTHVEGLWIAPSHRGKSAVARKLLAQMVLTAREMGAQVVNTASVSEDVTEMLDRLGAVELIGKHFALRIGAHHPCPQP